MPVCSYGNTSFFIFHCVNFIIVQGLCQIVYGNTAQYSGMFGGAFSAIQRVAAHIVRYFLKVGIAYRIVYML
jgi:hypothetical protein